MRWQLLNAISADAPTPQSTLAPILIAPTTHTSANVGNRMNIVFQKHPNYQCSTGTVKTISLLYHSPVPLRRRSSVSAVFSNRTGDRASEYILQILCCLSFRFSNRCLEPSPSLSMVDYLCWFLGALSFLVGGIFFLLSIFETHHLQIILHIDLR